MAEPVSYQAIDPATGKSSENLVKEEMNIAEGEQATEEIKEEPSCLEKFFSSRIVQLVIFGVLAGYGFFTVFSDWMLCRDILNGKQGLVFGPPWIGIQIALLIVTIFGTLSYIGEMANLIRETFFQVETVDEDMVQVVSIYLQEVPQITINMYIAACREAAISIFQLIKAVLGILGGFIRVAVLLSHFFSRKKKNKISWLERILVFLGAVYVFAGSLTVFTFIYTKPPDEGTGFRPPTGSIRGRTDDGKYLLNTSIYFSHPSFNACNNVSTQWLEKALNWIRIASVYNVKDGIVHMVYDVRPNYKTFIYVRTTKPANSRCYTTSNCTIIEHSNCPNTERPANLDTIYLTFRFRGRTQAMPLGDIRFNARHYSNNTCKEVHGQKPEGYLVDNNRFILAQLQYFWSSNDIEGSFITNEMGNIRYFFLGQVSSIYT